MIGIMALPITAAFLLARQMENTSIIGWDISASDMEGRSYRTQGYPEDLNLAAGKTGWNLWTMYQTTGYIQRDRSRFLDLVETDIDVYKGQSGSPVYSYRRGYGYCVEGMIMATSVKNEGEPRNFIILMNNFLTGFINNLP